MKDDLVLVMCPPHCDYPEAPKDQTHSELFDCPKCKNKMWLSEKKKGALMFALCINKDIIFSCYHCITKMSEEDASIIFASKAMYL